MKANKKERIENIKWEVTNLIIDGVTKEEILNCVLEQFAEMDSLKG